MPIPVGGVRPVAPAQVDQIFGPVAADAIPPPYRATVAFGLVLAFGALALFRSQRFIEESVDLSMARPYVSVVYGLIAYGLIAFLGLLVLAQLSFVGVSHRSVVYLVAGFSAVGALLLAGVGYVVVGTRLVELVDDRQPWNGLVLGAVLSAVTWLVLPVAAAAAVWVVLAATGVGGRVRTWIHDERGVRA